MSQSQKKKKNSSVLTYTFIVVRSVFSTVLEKRSGGVCVGQSARFLQASVTLAGEDFAQTGFSKFPIHLAQVEE